VYYQASKTLCKFNSQRAKFTSSIPRTIVIYFVTKFSIFDKQKYYFIFIISILHAGAAWQINAFSHYSFASENYEHFTPVRSFRKITYIKVRGRECVWQLRVFVNIKFREAEKITKNYFYSFSRIFKLRYEIKMKGTLSNSHRNLFFAMRHVPSARGVFM
jgi:hypothetical protein